MADAFGPDVAFQDRWLTLTGDAKFGDYQFNGAMALAKSLKAKPRDVAGKLVAVSRANGSRLWVAVTGAPTLTVPSVTHPMCATASPRGRVSSTSQLKPSPVMTPVSPT